MSERERCRAYAVYIDQHQANARHLNKVYTVRSGSNAIDYKTRSHDERITLVIIKSKS